MKWWKTKDSFDRAWSWGLEHPMVDWLFAAGILLLFVPGGPPSGFLDGSRSVLLQTIAGLSAAVALFAGGAAIFYYTSLGSRIKYLATRYGEGMDRAWIGLIMTSFTVAGLQVVALASGSGWTDWLAVYGMVLLFGAGSRLASLTSIMMSLVGADRRGPKRAPAPKVRKLSDE